MGRSRAPLARRCSRKCGSTVRLTCCRDRKEAVAPIGRLVQASRSITPTIGVPTSQAPIRYRTGILDPPSTGLAMRAESWSAPGPRWRANGDPPQNLRRCRCRRPKPPACAVSDRACFEFRTQPWLCEHNEVGAHRPVGAHRLRPRKRRRRRESGTPVAPVPAVSQTAGAGAAWRGGGEQCVRGGCEFVWVFWSSFPRRQQARRLRRAGARCAAAITAGALAVTAAGTRATALAGLLLVVMAALAVDTRRWIGWPLAAVSALGPRVRSDGCSAGWRRRGGGCSTRSRGAGPGMSTASRSPRLASGLRSKPKRARSMRATWPTPDRRPRGFTGIAGVGVGEERSRCCAWCVPAGWRGSRTGFLWSRLIA